MLYVFYGSDVSKSSSKALALVESLRTKRPDAAFIRLEAKDWDPSVVEQHLGGQGLFSNKYIVLLDRLSENTEAKEALSDFIAAFQESPNIFIALEGKLNAELKKAFEKSAEKSVVSDIPAESKGGFGKGDFNIFALADALGMRDAFKSWKIYREAIDNGIEPENIVGTLFWQAKSMVLARDAKSAGEAGVSPFVFSKAKKYAGNYSDEEMKGLVSDLIVLYHNGHRGMNDLELSIEKLLLNCAAPKL
jgi:DNA polymerase III delta subunit